MNETRPEPIPLIPSPDFVTRFNADNPGRYRTALDPLVMLAWHLASRPPPPEDMVRITGC